MSANEPITAPRAAIPPAAKTAPVVGAPSAKTESLPPEVTFDIRDLCVFYGAGQALHDVTLQIHAHQVTAIIGPSGCGKSTFIRTLNRMHELTPGARHTGSIRLLGQDLYGPGIDPTIVRRRVGMVFQKSNPFPTMSIAENVLVGLRLNGVRDKALLRQRLEESLRMAALWDEVKDILGRPGLGLSGGQQQRLCIARAIAVRPEVILMDEPCSALDVNGTRAIEELMFGLKGRYTILIVTHNMAQARRASDECIFMLLGKMIEHARTEQLFVTPKHPKTAEYIEGRYG